MYSSQYISYLYNCTVLLLTVFCINLSTVFQNMFFSLSTVETRYIRRSAQFDKKLSWCINRQFSLHGLDEILVFVYGLLVLIQQNV